MSGDIVSRTISIATIQETARENIHDLIFKDDLIISYPKYRRVSHTARTIETKADITEGLGKGADNGGQKVYTWYKDGDTWNNTPNELFYNNASQDGPHKYIPLFFGYNIAYHSGFMLVSYFNQNVTDPLATSIDPTENLREENFSVNAYKWDTTNKQWEFKGRVLTLTGSSGNPLFFGLKVFQMEIEGDYAKILTGGVRDRMSIKSNITTTDVNASDYWSNTVGLYFTKIRITTDPSNPGDSWTNLYSGSGENTGEVNFKTTMMMPFYNSDTNYGYGRTDFNVDKGPIAQDKGLSDKDMINTFANYCAWSFFMWAYSPLLGNAVLDVNGAITDDNYNAHEHRQYNINLTDKNVILHNDLIAVGDYLYSDSYSQNAVPTNLDWDATNSHDHFRDTFVYTAYTDIDQAYFANIGLNQITTPDSWENKVWINSGRILTYKIASGINTANVSIDKYKDIKPNTPYNFYGFGYNISVENDGNSYYISSNAGVYDNKTYDSLLKFSPIIFNSSQSNNRIFNARYNDGTADNIYYSFPILNRKTLTDSLNSSMDTMNSHATIIRINDINDIAVAPTQFNIPYKNEYGSNITSSTDSSIVSTGGQNMNCLVYEKGYTIATGTLDHNNAHSLSTDRNNLRRSSGIRIVKNNGNFYALVSVTNYPKPNGDLSSNALLIYKCSGSDNIWTKHNFTSLSDHDVKEANNFQTDIDVIGVNFDNNDLKLVNINKNNSDSHQLTILSNLFTDTTTSTITSTFEGIDAADVSTITSSLTLADSNDTITIPDIPEVKPQPGDSKKDANKKRKGIVDTTFTLNTDITSFKAKTSDMGLSSNFANKEFIKVLKSSPGDNSINVKTSIDSNTGWYMVIENDSNLTITPTFGSAFKIIKKAGTVEDTATYALTESGLKYYIDSVVTPNLTLVEGAKYVFTYPTGHPFRLSTTQDGTHSSGVVYDTGVVNTSGQTTFTVPSGITQPLYYYCSSHSNMGGRIDIVDGLYKFEATPKSSGTGFNSLKISGSSNTRTLPNGNHSNVKDIPGFLSVGDDVVLNLEPIAFGSIGGAGADPSGAGADPYVKTIDGELYKLDNIDGYCRMLQGNINGKELIINVELSMDSKLEENEMNNWVKNLGRFKETTNTINTDYFEQSFFSKIFVKYGDSKLVYDILKSKVIEEHGDMIEREDIKDTVGCSLPMYENDTVDKVTELYIESACLRLLKYNNKQIRSAIDIVNGSRINDKYGFVVSPMNTENCRVESLDDTKLLKRKNVPSFKKQINEIFETKNRENKTNKVKYVVNCY